MQTFRDRLERVPHGPLVPLTFDVLARRVAGELAPSDFADAFREARDPERIAGRAPVLERVGHHPGGPRHRDPLGRRARARGWGASRPQP